MAIAAIRWRAIFFGTTGCFASLKSFEIPLLLIVFGNHHKEIIGLGIPGLFHDVSTAI